MPGKRKERPRREDAPPPLDPRTAERHLGELLGDLSKQEFKTIEDAREYITRRLSGDRGPEREPTPLEIAQQLVYDAWEAPSRRKSVNLARRALDLSRDCADAYLVLVELQDCTIAEAIALCEAAVRAGERALGPDAFKTYEGGFWGAIVTRPYMRARAALAQALWVAGEHDAALEHARALLELNPGDNQGMRYLYAGWLLKARDHAGLSRLLERYDEVCADLSYPRALLLFRLQGDTENSRDALRLALASNLHVPEYLLGRRPLPDEVADSFSPGDENEAAVVALRTASSWQDTPGALDWLRGRLEAIA
ncbi:MAG: hypothetical protein R6X12_01175 [bacterium]